MIDRATLVEVPVLIECLEGKKDFPVAISTTNEGRKIFYSI